MTCWSVVTTRYIKHVRAYVVHVRRSFCGKWCLGVLRCSLRCTNSERKSSMHRPLNVLERVPPNKEYEVPEGVRVRSYQNKGELEKKKTRCLLLIVPCRRVLLYVSIVDPGKKP